MARSTGTRKILSGNSLFFLIRTLGRHLEKESHFMACYRRDIYLWTELGQELCCLHPCTSRAGQRPSPVTSNYLRPVVYMKAGRRDLCIHVLHSTPQCIPTIYIMKETTANFLIFVCESILCGACTFGRGFNVR